MTHRYLHQVFEGVREISATLVVGFHMSLPGQFWVPANSVEPRYLG